MRRSAIIVGGGIAGLSAAVALRRAGYEIAIFEQAPKLEPIGAAISIWGNAMAGLDWLGCGGAVRARSPQVTQVKLTDLAGRVLFGPVDAAALDGWLPMRSHLQAVLFEALGEDSLRLGTAVEAVEEADGTVLAIGGGSVLGEADIAIVADGIHSAIATRLLGNPPIYRGYGGVIGVAESPPEDGAAGLAHEIWGARERFGLFDAGNGRRYWFYMAPFEQAEQLEAVSHAAIAERASGWPESVSAAVAATAPASLIRIPIHARPLPQRLGRGRVICIGDAAHAMEPNQGQGGCQGIEDAWALGVLASKLEPAKILPMLERARLRRVRSYWTDSQRVGDAAHSPSRLLRGLMRNALGMAPARFDAIQLERRHRPPVYT